MAFPKQAPDVSTRWLRLSLVAGALVCAGPWDATIAHRDGQTQWQPEEHWEYCDNDDDESYELADVISHCTSLIQGWPVAGGTLSDAYFGRARAYLEQGDDARAIPDYSQAIRLNPLASYAYFGRALAYERRGDHARAAADRAEHARLQSARPR